MATLPVFSRLATDKMGELLQKRPSRGTPGSVGALSGSFLPALAAADDTGHLLGRGTRTWRPGSERLPHPPAPSPCAGRQAEMSVRQRRPHLAAEPAGTALTPRPPLPLRSDKGRFWGRRRHWLVAVGRAGTALTPQPLLPWRWLTRGGIRFESAAAPRGRVLRGSLTPQPPLPWRSDRGRYPSGSGRAAAIRGSGGGLGPPPDQFLPLSHRDGRGGWGVRAVPASPAARCERRFRTDTYPAC